MRLTAFVTGVVLAGPVSGFAARYVWPLLWLGMRTEAATVAHRHGPLPAT